MPTLKITLTTELSDAPLDAFRERHAIEEHVLKLLAAVTAESRSVTIDVETITGGLKQVRRRNARPRLAVVPEPAA